MRWVLVALVTRSAMGLNCGLSPRQDLVVRRSKNGDASPDELLERAASLRREAEAMEATLPKRDPPPPPPPPVTTPPEFVVRQVVHAFDNLPPAEPTEALDRIWLRDRQARDALLDLAKQADAIEKAFEKQSVAPEDAADAIRVLRSRIRMWTKAFLPEPPPGSGLFSGLF